MGANEGRSSIARFTGTGIILLPLFLLVPLPAWAQEAARHENVLETFVRPVTLYVATAVEAAAAMVIAIASVRAIIAYFANVLRPEGTAVPKDAIRLSLGRSLALALEFELGADILKTAIAPTWNEIGQLAAIAALRTLLNFFLDRELREAGKREPQISKHAENT